MLVSSRRSVLAGLAALAMLPLASSARGTARAEGGRASTDDERIVRELYRVAESPGLDPEKFVSGFADDGYFLDVSSGQRWVGREVRGPVTGLIAAYPDMHRELLEIYSAREGVVVVELKLQGTHKGDLPLPDGVLRATGKRFDVRCCDVWHLENGKVTSFHCYNALVAYLQG